MDDVIVAAEKNPEVRTISGRVRPIPEILSSNRPVKENGNRMAINTIIQGSAADIIKIAMIRIHEHLQNHGEQTDICRCTTNWFLNTRPPRKNSCWRWSGTKWKMPWS